jgi:hypothetical protein
MHIGWKNGQNWPCARVENENAICDTALLYSHIESVPFRFSGQGCIFKTLFSQKHIEELVETVHSIKYPAELYVNSGQIQVIFAQGTNLTWDKTGAKQVSVVGAEEKRAITILVSFSSPVNSFQFNSTLRERLFPAHALACYKKRQSWNEIRILKIENVLVNPALEVTLC